MQSFFTLVRLGGDIRFRNHSHMINNAIRSTLGDLNAAAHGSDCSDVHDGIVGCYIVPSSATWIAVCHHM